MDTPNFRPIDKFGRIAVEKNYVSMQRLHECLKIQLAYERAGRGVPKLGTILLAKKYLTPKQVREILNIQNAEGTANAVRTFHAGDIIFREGAADDHSLFLLNKGRVELKKKGVQLDVRKAPGTFFGISGFLLKCPRSATAIAQTDCEIMQLAAGNAAAFFKNKPEMLLRLTARLAGSLLQMKTAYAELRSRTAENAARPPVQKNPAAASAAPSTPAVNAAASAPAASKTGDDDLPPEFAAAASVSNTDTAAPAPAAPKTVDDDLPPEFAAAASVPNTDTAAPAPAASKAVDDDLPPEFAAAAAIQNAQTSAPATDAHPAPAEEVPPEFTAALSPDSPPESAAAAPLPPLSAELGVPPAVADASPMPAPVQTVADAAAKAAAALLAPDADMEKLNAGAVKFADALAAVKPLPFTDKIRHVVKARIDLYLQIEKLEEERNALEKKYSPPAERLKIELSRQRREFVKIPAAEALQNSLDKLTERLKAPVAPAAAPAPAAPPEPKPAPAPAPADESAPGDENAAKLAKVKQLLGDLGNLEFIDPNDFADDEILEDAAENSEEETPPEPAAAAAPALEEDMREAYEIAVRQKKVLLERYRTTEETLAVCAQCCVNEPLYMILKKEGIDPNGVFGWGVLVFALREYAEAQNAKLKALQKDKAGADESKTSSSWRFLRLINNKADDGHDKSWAALADEEKKRRQIVINVNRDINASTPEMVNIFWDVYEKLAQKYVAGMSKEAGVLTRSFLRWGMLGVSSRWLTPEQMRGIITDCYPPSAVPANTLASTNLYYADEIILFTALGKLPPSPNEDLELNHRNSKEWKVDRAWRRMVNGQGYEVALRELMKTQLDITDVMRRNVAEIEKIIDKKKLSTNPDKKKVIASLRQKAQNFKVKAARNEKTAERISMNLLPRNQEEIESCQQILNEVDIAITPEALAAHEIKCLRRNSRLVAKLKEPYLPLALRDHFKPELGGVNARTAAMEMLADTERRDPSVFLEPILPNMKKQHQVFMRRTPIITIAPAGGVLGFVMSPRSGLESGRFIMPAYVERATMREEILWNALSDFRYDTSKASAGVDIMTSDTLVAAYANVRWNLRKRDRELRQKAGIYTEENERTNFRRHYALYMKSALDGGKLLFFKCPELYELIINKFIDLPEGCELLKR